MEEVERLIELLLSNDEVMPDEPNDPDPKVWIGRGDVRTPIKEMKDSHLKNAILFWQDWMNPLRTRRYKSRHDNGHDERAKCFQKIEQTLNRKQRKVLRKFCVQLGHQRSLVYNAKYKYLIEEAKRRELYAN